MHFQDMFLMEYLHCGSPQVISENICDPLLHINDNLGMSVSSGVR